MSSATKSLGQKLLSALVVLLTTSAVYLYGFPETNVEYACVVLLHAVGGVVAMVWVVASLRRLVCAGSGVFAAGWALFLAGGGIGLWLIHTGTLRAEWNWMYAHMVVCTAAVGLLIAGRMSRRGWLGSGAGAAAGQVAVCLVALAGVGVVLRYTREARWANRARIENPEMPPLSMEQEGDGPQGPFFPSSAQVYGHRKIPSKFFMESDSCRRCHQDIYQQWKSSAHHFASFNNQWYRKSIEYMQDVIGTRTSKWCAGCHDHAVFFNGRFDRPIKEQIDTPEAQNGLGCTSCHSIVHVKSTMGQGDFTIEYPPMHDLAVSDNRFLRWTHDYLLYVDPQPHRETFLKSFHTTQTPEFCSSCHKVHLDVPVNNYRWFRGFNEYDNWQASGVSGEGARSFYYPPKSQKCADCHMPLVASQDPAARDGKVHSHRFPGANTAVPYVNHDDEQLKTTQDFLQDGQVSIDIFGMARTAAPAPQTEKKKTAQEEPQLASTFAIGEE